MEIRKNPAISMVSKALAKRIDKQCKQYKAERDKLEAQKIAFARSYKQVVEENKELKKEIKRLKKDDLNE